MRSLDRVPCSFGLFCSDGFNPPSDLQCFDGGVGDALPNRREDGKRSSLTVSISHAVTTFDDISYIWGLVLR